MQQITVKVINNPTPFPFPKIHYLQPLTQTLVLTHPMIIRSRIANNRPTQHLNLHVSSISLLLKSYNAAFNDPNWKNAMTDEHNALINNNTWILVPRPTNANILRCMWLFFHKFLANGTLSRYKARLVVNGSTQIEGINVDETFSPIIKLGTIRTVLSLALSRHWPVHQLDVKNAFLHGDLTETVYMHQPLGFRDPTHPDYCKYATEILKQAHMANCNPSRTPIDTESKLGDDGDPVSDPTLYRSLAGSIQYLTFTRPDISYAAQQLFSLSTFSLVAYSDANWAGCPTTQRSTSGYCVFLGNNLLSWSAKRQSTLSRSSAEAEYRGVANAVAETCWLRNLLRELHTPLSSATLVCCDNVSAVYLSSNPVQHQRTKHIAIDIHFERYQQPDVAKDSLGVASKSARTHSMHRESWWFCDEVQTKVAMKQSWFKELLVCSDENQEDIDLAKERYKVAMREAKIAVAQAKDKAYENLYMKLDSKEGTNDIYKIARARERKRMDIGNVRYIKDEDPKRGRDVGSSRHQMHYDYYHLRINQGEVRATLQRMGRNKAVCPNQFPIEAWRCLEDEGVKWRRAIM
nr:ribonuclease H-like domain-containing protein [Tanacetum cinerariifolium]